VVNSSIIKNYKDELQKIDKALIGIDKKLIILTHLIPTNIEEQRQLFVESEGSHVPIFTYNKPDLDFDQLLKNLSAIDIPEIPLSGLYIRKKEEVENKILFLKAFRENEARDMTLYSKKLF